MTSIRRMAVAVMAVGMLAGLTSARGDQRVSLAYDMPMVVTLNLNSSDCDNSPGPFITLEGAIVLGGLNAEVIFQNNVKGTHQATEAVTGTAVVVPAGGSITIPKQPVLGGVGGNPWIYIQLFNAEGNLTPEILVGRCVQGWKMEKNLLNSAVASLLVIASECSNNPGPWITLGGQTTLSGLKARVIFKNNVKGTHVKPVCAEVELLPEGACIVIPKQPPLGGVGGNPWIWVQFLDAAESCLGDPFFLGRCSEL